MDSSALSRARSLIVEVSIVFAFCMVGSLAIAQSPFDTGANALVTDFIAIATPIAILVVMVLGVVAMAGRISWGWPLAALGGICVLFGAPQIIDWVRGVFAV
jgi:type IV secretion system protein VirB2